MLFVCQQHYHFITPEIIIVVRKLHRIPLGIKKLIHLSVLFFLVLFRSFCSCSYLFSFLLPHISHFVKSPNGLKNLYKYFSQGTKKHCIRSEWLGSMTSFRVLAPTRTTLVDIRTEQSNTDHSTIDILRCWPQTWY